MIALGTMRYVPAMPPSSGMAPDERTLFLDRMRASEHRRRYRRTGMTFREWSRRDEAMAVARLQPVHAPVLCHIGALPIDDCWLWKVSAPRRRSRFLQAAERIVLRLPVIVLLPLAWGVLFGILLLIGQAFRLIF